VRYDGVARIMGLTIVTAAWAVAALAAVAVDVRAIRDILAGRRGSQEKAELLETARSYGGTGRMLAAAVVADVLAPWSALARGVTRPGAWDRLGR
jgi:hypothetical protein